jgi:Rrf2 family transcriptional regulator, iron-sulfur cluster assembly transcription factor
MLSKSAIYAIQALSYLTLRAVDERPVPIAQIAEDLSIPYHFLKKILADLAIKGLLKSQRSAKGGVSLIKDPRQLSVLDIIIATDGADMFQECILKPCPMHHSWAIERGRLRTMFAGTTIHDLAHRIETKGYRLS